MTTESVGVMCLPCFYVFVDNRTHASAAFERDEYVKAGR